MSIELSKKDKKIARDLIAKGLKTEFSEFLKSVDMILHTWKDGKVDEENSYRNLYKAVKEFDKHIAARYDHVTGSTYIFVLAALLKNKIISEEDLTGMEEPVQNTVMFVVREI